MYKFAAVYTDKINQILSERYSAVKKEALVSDIQFFPNPINGSFVIKNQKGFQHDDYIEIYNTTGKVVFSGIPAYDTTEYLIDQNNLIKGIYFLSVRQKNKSNMFSFVVN
jgi:hypothetical protein